MKAEEQNSTLLDAYINIYNTYNRLNSIKSLVKDSVEFKNNEISFKNVFAFGDDLLKLIKYTDEEFYNKLEKKQQGAEQ